MTATNKSEVWTVWCDYFATGEGRRVMACITPASSEAQALEKFGALFDEYFARGAEAHFGVVRNEVTRFLWSKAMIDWVAHIAAKGGWVEAHAQVFVDLS